MMMRLNIISGKIVSWFSQKIGLGAGATWPGEIALWLNPSILKFLVAQLHEGVIIVAGTNGKTTTSLMIKTILEHEGKTVVHNGSGANLLNGVVSAFIQNASWSGKIQADWGVFEVDENSLPQIISNIKYQISNIHRKNQIGKDKKIIVVLLNLFRDQLDRYGEVDVIAEKWQRALSALDTGNQTIKPYQLIVNADDPLIAHLGMSFPSASSTPGVEPGVVYFGLNDPKSYLPKMEHATDSTFCLNCDHRLNYQGIYYAHIGIWNCPNCREKRPIPHLTRWKSPLPGLYNLYNTLAAASVAKNLKISDKVINESLTDFAPAFGRQEEFDVGRKRIKIFLSKNPAGFNTSLRTVLELKPKVIILVLNDRIPDGRDVSWIWDVDFEMLVQDEHLMKERDQHMIIVSGDRCWDMALRIKYTQNSELRTQNSIIEPELRTAIDKGLKLTKNGETLYILPTYSAMLEVRKILTGKKIL